MPLKFKCPKCGAEQLDEGQTCCHYCKVIFSMATLWTLANYKGDPSKVVDTRKPIS
jgi:hypothetical protein